eukprot:1148856-Pelagomonas_calceolata.AAC.2
MAFRRARSDQGNVRAAGIASCLITGRNARVKRLQGLKGKKASVKTASGSSEVDCMFLVVGGACAVLEDCAQREMVSIGTLNMAKWAENAARAMLTSAYRIRRF